MESIVIIGNGMVGHQLVEQLVASGSHLEKRIIVIGEERFVAYDRVHLSAMFSGQSHQDLLLSSEEWYQKHGIELILGVAVVGIERQSKRVTLEDESQLSYDQLVFATGSYPFVPRWQEVSAARCLSTEPWMICRRLSKRVLVRRKVP